ncbi:MAG TPA: 5-(carboxyamino)imidazole ribonucleotide synthase, partial [Planctomycetaceae bacterium]|nr:5-(carboxyamino)imidazole ribonucleotide synthase [Planctomycetaceae bacterium]
GEARRMGYRVHSLDPTMDCPAGQVADVEVVADYDDLDAARRFASGVDVVTFEFENIPAETLRVIAETRPVHPSPEVLHVCRHRRREKDFLQSHGFPLAAYRAVDSAAALAHAVAELGTPAILKTADFGYDGKGQVRIDRPDECDDAWSKMGRPLGVLEAFVPFTQEVSVIVARANSGEMACFGPVENVHVHHILDVTAAPASVGPTVGRQALDLGRAIAETLGVVGLLAVEMFVVGERVLVNELAPRPHNSGHYSLDACLTSQFEQQLRAVCGLPLGDVQLLRPAAMANLLGDQWTAGEPNWAAALAFGDVKLHLYGKHEARPGRKMGHMTALAETREGARERVVAARAALGTQE